MCLFRGMLWVWSGVPLVGVGVAPGGSLTFRTGHLRPRFLDHGHLDLDLTYPNLPYLPYSPGPLPGWIRVV